MVKFISDNERRRLRGNGEVHLGQRGATAKFISDNERRQARGDDEIHLGQRERDHPFVVSNAKFRRPGERASFLWENAYYYNEDGSEIWQLAKELEESLLGLVCRAPRRA
ncbi:hypothetical protein MAPG_10449 [Magnaporthiopsis poae ATCC 64411]|uniref:Uncharacterized protein n=1 Tax=Magnaporthiopsis poae (strain ATCC 64411 / 73-15) TaxID=644358 RepID=A0A0C4ECL8_MAGP6|nr:hypothetical protein MAPG_10449 [Magnaporthiopsis poae ATCC 64411]